MNDYKTVLKKTTRQPEINPAHPTPLLPLSPQQVVGKRSGHPEAQQRCLLEGDCQPQWPLNEALCGRQHWGVKWDPAACIINSFITVITWRLVAEVNIVCRCVRLCVFPYFFFFFPGIMSWDTQTQSNTTVTVGLMCCGADQNVNPSHCLLKVCGKDFWFWIYAAHSI